MKTLIITLSIISFLGCKEKAVTVEEVKPFPFKDGQVLFVDGKEGISRFAVCGGKIHLMEIAYKDGSAYVDHSSFLLCASHINGRLTMRQHAGLDPVDNPDAYNGITMENESLISFYTENEWKEVINSLP